LAVQAPDKAWVTHITHMRTWHGWLYLAAVIDLDSRKVVGWSMKPTPGRELALDALLMALTRRTPRQSAIVHSDQGSQYGSDDWQQFCRSHRLEPSMSRRGNCWDNAVAESFLSGLKKERIYIEVFSNRTRRHSHLPTFRRERGVPATETTDVLDFLLCDFAPIVVTHSCDVVA